MLRVDVAYSEPGKPLQTVQNLAAQTPDLLQFTGGKRIRDAFKGLVSGNYLKLGKGRISGKEPLAALGLAVVGSKLGIVKSNKSPKASYFDYLIQIKIIIFATVATAVSVSSPTALGSILI